MSIETAMAALNTTPETTVTTHAAVEPKTEETKEVPTDEAKKEEPKTEEKPKDEEIKARRFAELSKKEQRILQKKREMEESFKAREEALKSREHLIKEYEEVKKLAKTNPGEAIEKIGTDYQAVTDHYLNHGKLTPELVARDVESKIQELERKLQEQAKTFETREKERIAEENRKTLENFSATIVETVKASSDKYPSVAAFDGAPVIYEMIQKRWHDTGGNHLMTIDEAAEILEKELDSVISKVVQTPKYSARFSSTKKEEPKPTSLNKPKTITNDLTSSAPSLLPAKTENDRIKRALEKLAGA